MRWWWLAVLAGCGSDPLIVTPTFVDFGEVDFQQARPDTGYNQQTINLQNSGKRDLDLQVAGIDETRVFVGAFWLSEDEHTLPTIQGGSYTDLTLSVWDYDHEAGELTTTITGSIQVEGKALSDPIEIDWSYVPVRNIPVDTGN
jgi:hypothetical protein